MHRHILTAVFCILATGAHAQDATQPFPEALRGMVGEWSLEQDDATKFQCTIGLTDQWAIGGFGVEIPEECLSGGPTADIAAWSIDDADGSVVFTDALRKPVLRLMEEGDGGIFASDIATPPQYYLVATE